MRSFVAALGFLTILPTGGAFPENPGRAFAWFPLVGLLVGVLLWGVAQIPAGPLVPFLIVVAWVVVTGGLHLDGFGDACDGLIASVPAERRLAIMKDPQAGTWAVVGLILLLLGKYVTLNALPDPRPLILVPVMGRWAMVLAAWGFPYAREAGLGGTFREGLDLPQVIAASLTAIGAAVVIGWWAGWGGLLLASVPALTVAIGGRWAASRLGGGLTGDVYGALCETTEVLCLTMLMIRLSPLTP